MQRYAELVEQLQWLARRIQTFSAQVHVGIRDGSKAIPIVSALAGYLSHFLALTASSPFWSGQDTGLASSRAVVFGGLPTSGPPPLLADWSEFEDYMDTLLRAGTIRSIKEVWWDIRPHPDFGTVEIRMFDGVPTLREVGMIAALSQSLVQLFDNQLDRGYERLGCAAELEVLSEVLDHGASDERQRAVVAAGGELTDVVDALAAEFAQDCLVVPGEAANAGT